MREIGICSPLFMLAGLLPKDCKDIYPNERIKGLGWGGL